MTKVRFAPSPTGNLHIGGARTALFNWLYCRATKGKFILRIEDTDEVRSRPEYVQEILSSLSWLGLKWDEVYSQSERIGLYKQHAQRLLEEGKAYVEKREDRSGEAVIYKVSPAKIKVRDLIRGEIEFDTSVIKDQVLIKSDGTPTYNFACVVDDALTGITHVIRGDDHLSNTPKQLMLYAALGFNAPYFAHLPLILGIEGGRLSKRSGATAISDYRKAGYLPEALLNYLLLLSWSPGDNREVISIEEAVKLFEIGKVSKTAATFDLKKLNWFNNQYLKKESAGKLAEEIIPLLLKRGLIEKDKFDRNYIVSLVELFQQRLSTLSDFPDWADFFFLKEIRPNPEAEKKFLSRDLSREFTLFAERLDGLKEFTAASIEESFRALVQELNIESRQLIHPIRVALTGKTIGPGLFEVIYYLGRQRVRERLLRWCKRSS
jgi:glutamyl-tRNA synthetase